MTAVTPFRFLNLPREVRDDIYEAAIFDLRPPDMFLSIASPDSIRFRKMNTNIVLTNRQAYWEAQDVILRRGQLIMVSFPGFTKFWSLTDSCGITGINPMYRSLCIMTHHSKLQISTYGFLQVTILNNWHIYGAKPCLLFPIP